LIFFIYIIHWLQIYYFSHLLLIWMLEDLWKHILTCRSVEFSVRKRRYWSWGSSWSYKINLASNRVGLHKTRVTMQTRWHYWLSYKRSWLRKLTFCDRKTVQWKINWMQIFTFNTSSKTTSSTWKSKETSSHSQPIHGPPPTDIRVILPAPPWRLPAPPYFSKISILDILKRRKGPSS